LKVNQAHHDLGWFHTSYIIQQCEV
jgi:hypothetical protein